MTRSDIAKTKVESHYDLHINYSSTYLYNVRMNLNGTITKLYIITFGHYNHLVNGEFVKQSTFYGIAKLDFIGIADDKIHENIYFTAFVDVSEKLVQ